MFQYPWGDMHSLNLGWFLMQFKAWVDKIQEYLDNGGGTDENLANVIAPVFNAANSYLTGDYVLYNDELYKALEPVPAGTWNPDAWERCLVTEEMGSSSSGVDNVARLMIAGQYSNTYNYQKYAICRYSDRLWMCNTNLPTGGEEWTPAHWDEITVGAGLTGLRRSVDTLQSEITNLNSDDIANQSENVAGDNVTDAIDALFNAISAFGSVPLAVNKGGSGATTSLNAVTEFVGDSFSVVADTIATGITKKYGGARNGFRGLMFIFGTNGIDLGMYMISVVNASWKFSTIKAPTTTDMTVTSDLTGITIANNTGGTLGIRFMNFTSSQYKALPEITIIE